MWSAPGESHFWDPVPSVREIIGVTLSSVPKGTKARASHLITGPEASCPGSYDHQKTEGALGGTYHRVAYGQPPY
jgi:hypothetical protein